MSLDVLEEMIQQIMNNTEGPVGIAWQGGEPTLAGLEFYDTVVKLEMKHGRPGQVVSNAIQTNGVLLDNDWARFLRRYSFLTGLSLDGPANLHDRYRRNKNGRPSFHLVYPKIQILKSHGVAFNLLVVINEETVKYPRELYNFCIDNDIRFVQFIPAVELDANGKLADFSVSEAQYGDFLCVLFDVWYNSGNPYISVRMFDTCFERIITGESSICCFGDSCDSTLVVEANGDVYPCDFFVEPTWKIGNLMENPLWELERTELRIKFAAIKSDLPQSCLQCEWKDFCYGGCPKYRAFKTPNYMCSAYKRFFSYCFQRLKRVNLFS